MGLFKMFKSPEMPPVEPVKLKRVPEAHTEGHWAPKDEELSYETQPERLQKINELREKERAERERRLQTLKN